MSSIDDIEISDEEPCEYEIEKNSKISKDIKNKDLILDIIKKMNDSQLNDYLEKCYNKNDLNPENESFTEIDEDNYNNYIKMKKIKKFRMMNEEKQE